MLSRINRLLESARSKSVFVWKYGERSFAGHDDRSSVHDVQLLESVEAKYYDDGFVEIHFEFPRTMRVVLENVDLLVGGRGVGKSNFIYFFTGTICFVRVFRWAEYGGCESTSVLVAASLDVYLNCVSNGMSRQIWIKAYVGPAFMVSRSIGTGKHLGGPLARGGKVITARSETARESALMAEATRVGAEESAVQEGRLGTNQVGCSAQHSDTDQPISSSVWTANWVDEKLVLISLSGYSGAVESETIGIYAPGKSTQINITAIVQFEEMLGSHFICSCRDLSALLSYGLPASLRLSVIIDDLPEVVCASGGENLRRHCLEFVARVRQVEADIGMDDFSVSGFRKYRRRARRWRRLGADITTFVSALRQMAGEEGLKIFGEAPHFRRLFGFVELPCPPVLATQVRGWLGPSAGPPLNSGGITEVLAQSSGRQTVNGPDSL